MTTSASHEVTQLLLAWSEGDQAALEQLMPLVYAELRRLAKRYMRNERAGHTLQTTALIHEAYLRLIDAPRALAKSRALLCDRCPPDAADSRRLRPRTRLSEAWRRSPQGL